MLAPTLKLRPVISQVQGETPQALARILDDGVNLAIWQRRLPVHIADFGGLLLSLNEPLAESLVLEIPGDDTEPNLQGLASGFSDLEGMKALSPTFPGWSVHSPVCWAPSVSACVCGFWTKPCARVFTSIMCRCA